MKRKIVILTLILLLMITSLPVKSMALIPINSADLYSKSKRTDLLKWNGVGVLSYYVVYKKDGVEYPAYCLNKDVPGVGDDVSYSVSVDELITDVKVWKAITNGFPYKSVESLGCKTEEEAFLATKQASYCMIYDRDPHLYEAIGEAGERTKNAMIHIVEAANSSTATKVSADLEIISEETLWKIDSLNNKYVSRTFKVSAKAPMDSYKIKLEGEIPEGLLLTNEKNEAKNEFTSNEKFKILIPLKNIMKDGNFNIRAFGKVKTKPILYGKSGNAGFQDYALTGAVYEDGEGNEKIYYNTNQTKIVILKKTNKTNTLLEGVEFQLLDENKNVLYTELKTNAKGEILIDNLLPGTYFIQETKTLEGYSLYDKLIEINLELNETANVTINNSEKDVKIENKFVKTNVEVSNLESVKEVKNIQVKTVKLPKTGM